MIKLYSDLIAFALSRGWRAHREVLRPMAETIVEVLDEREKSFATTRTGLK